jgi:hypothetical protein
LPAVSWPCADQLVNPITQPQAVVSEPAVDPCGLPSQNLAAGQRDFRTPRRILTGIDTGRRSRTQPDCDPENWLQRLE